MVDHADLMCILIECVTTDVEKIIDSWKEICHVIRLDHVSGAIPVVTHSLGLFEVNANIE